MILTSLIIFTVGWIFVFRYRSEHLGTKLAAASAAERRWIPITAIVISTHITIVQLFFTLVMIGVAARTVVGEPHEIALGVAVFFVGIAWWFWARRSLGPVDRYLDTVNPPSRLLVNGPFAVVRHPLAFGTLLCALGPAIAASSLVTWLTFAASAVCLAKRCAQDEEVLRDVFGQAYGSYAAQTRRLVPFVW